MKYALALLLISCGGCAGQTGALMTQPEISTYGTHVFPASRKKVFTAVVQALKVEGYQIAVENPEKGIVRTARKVLRADAIGGPGYAVAVDVSRQYFVDVRAHNGGTEVVARPRVFRGETDLSDEKVWLLEGPAGERTLWSKLFRDIGELL